MKNKWIIEKLKPTEDMIWAAEYWKRCNIFAHNVRMGTATITINNSGVTITINNNGIRLKENNDSTSIQLCEREVGGTDKVPRAIGFVAFRPESRPDVE